MRFVRQLRQKRCDRIGAFRGAIEKSSAGDDSLIDLTNQEETLAQMGDTLSPQQRSKLYKFERVLVALGKEGSGTSIVKHVSNRSSNDAYQLQPRHFRGILQNRWIEDTVVDAYLLLLRDLAGSKRITDLTILCTHVFVMLGGMGADSTSCTGLEKYFTPTTRYYYSPVLINGNHWISVIFDVAEMRVHVYDSLRFAVSRYQDYLRAAIRAVTRLHHRHGRVDLMDAEATIVRIRDMPRQTNTRDCGLYMLAHARSICEGVSVERTTLGENVERYGRRRLVLSLYECRVL
eukprot:gene837-1318_t